MERTDGPTKLKAPFHPLLWELERTETALLARARFWRLDELEEKIVRVFDYAYAFAWEKK